MGPLVRWEPTMQISRLRDEMNRLIQDFFGEVGEERTPTDMMRMPSVDVLDRESEILVRAEMPGIDKENIKLEVTPDALLIRADVKKEQEEKEANFLRHERRISTYQRIVPLPVEVKPTDVKANYRDGVLEVTLPKSDRARTKQPVKVSIE